MHKGVCISLPVQGEGGGKEVMPFLQPIDAVAWGAENSLFLKCLSLAFHLVYSISTAAAQPLLTELFFLQLLQVELRSPVIVFCQDMARAWMQRAAALLYWNLKSTFINET